MQPKQEKSLETSQNIEIELLNGEEQNSDKNSFSKTETLSNEVAKVLQELTERISEQPNNPSHCLPEDIKDESEAIPPRVDPIKTRRRKWHSPTPGFIPLELLFEPPGITEERRLRERLFEAECVRHTKLVELLREYLEGPLCPWILKQMDLLGLYKLAMYDPTMLDAVDPSRISVLIPHELPARKKIGKKRMVRILLTYHIAKIFLNPPEELLHLKDQMSKYLNHVWMKLAYFVMSGDSSWLKGPTFSAIMPMPFFNSVEEREQMYRNWLQFWKYVENVHACRYYKKYKWRVRDPDFVKEMHEICQLKNFSESSLVDTLFDLSLLFESAELNQWEMRPRFQRKYVSRYATRLWYRIDMNMKGHNSPLDMLIREKFIINDDL